MQSDPEITVLTSTAFGLPIPQVHLVIFSTSYKNPRRFPTDLEAVHAGSVRHKLLCITKVKKTKSLHSLQNPTNPKSKLLGAKLVSYRKEKSKAQTPFSITN